jgi:hypothetical protein
MTGSLSRRSLVIAGAAGAAALGRTPAQAAGNADHDPRLTAEGQVKMGATLDDTPAFWVYSGVVYAVRPEQKPLPILALSGCEAHWPKAQPDGSFRVAGATISFFRDVESGAFLDTFDNPITGKRNVVKPNVLTGGAAVFPADGSSVRAEGQIKSAVIAPGGFRRADPRQALGGVRWSVIGPTVMLMTDHSWNVPVQPQLEAQTQTADRAAFFDPAVRRMPARYTATTIIPWMTWMDMAGAPGHLVWHSSGEKGFSLDLAPADYRARAGSFMDLLSTRPA